MGTKNNDYFEELISKKENLTDKEFCYLLENARPSSKRKAKAVYKKLLNDALFIEHYEYISNPIQENLKDLNWVHNVCRNALGTG
jgi:hypothetical protein